MCVLNKITTIYVLKHEGVTLRSTCGFPRVDLDSCGRYLGRIYKLELGTEALQVAHWEKTVVRRGLPGARELRQKHPEFNSAARFVDFCIVERGAQSDSILL